MVTRPGTQWASVTRGRIKQKVGSNIVVWDLTNDGLEKIHVTTHVQ